MNRLNMLSHRLRHCFLMFALMGLLSHLSMAVTLSSVSQHGVTWTFSSAKECGQFANGDWWVVGPVTINSISPAWDGTRHGTVIDPPVNGSQGFDTRIQTNQYSNKNIFSSTLNVADDLPVTVSAGSSVLSCISKQNSVSGDDPQMDTIAILTVLSSAAPAGSFRPPYQAGTSKSLNWNVSDLDYSVLNTLPRGNLQHVPDLNTVSGYFARPWIELVTNWQGRYMHPASNYPTFFSNYVGNYGREIAHTASYGLLSLQLDYSNQEKEELLIRMCQAGIDVYGALTSGLRFDADGGHNPGRKMVMLLAAKALNDPTMLALCDGTTYRYFQEDQQTFYVSAADVAISHQAPNDKPTEDYTSSDIGLAEWGFQHYSNPGRDNKMWVTPYRLVNGACTPGHILTAHLMDVVDDWNWDAAFDYYDRWWSIDGDRVGTSPNSVQPFVAEMWNTYRYADGPGSFNQVSSPAFSPSGGVYNASQSITISTSTSGASIRYTTDGSNPSSTVGTVYSSAFNLSNSGTLKAIAYKSGMSDSFINSANYIFYPQGWVIGTQSSLFVNTGFIEQDAVFEVTFSAMSSSQNEDVAIGLSDGLASAYSDLAAIVRLNASGFIDARDGSVYSSDNSITYAANTRYDFRLEVDLSAGTYAAYVTPFGGSELTIGEDYDFRTEQASVSVLNTWSIRVGSTGSAAVGAFSVSNGTTDTQAPSTPTGLTSSNVTENSVDLDWNASTDNVGVSGYNLYVNGSPVSVSGTSITVGYLSPSTSYTFTVSAYDAAGNESSESSSINVTTSSASSSYLIEEYFSSAVSDFATIGGGAWNVSGGKYVLSNPNTSTPAGTLGNISINDNVVADDFVLTATLNITGTSSVWNDAAIVFGYQDANNYYYVSLNESNDGDTKGVFKVVSGTPTELADISLSVSSDTDYAIEIERSGAAIVVDVNSSQVASVNDLTFIGGQIGFGTKNDSASFDSLIVEETGAGSDTEAPTTPSGLSASNITGTTVDLSWSASSDNVGVTGYYVYTNSQSPIFVSGTSATIPGLMEGTAYTFNVSATDEAGNESGLSSGVSATTSSTVITTLSINGENTDVGLNDDGSKVYVGDSDIRIGGASTKDRAMILVFELPTLSSGESITEARLTVELSDIANNPSGNADLYGLPYQSTVSIGSSEYYDGSYGGDTGADALQEDILTLSTAIGSVSTNSSGSSNLLDYINDQYANGAEGGDFILLRLNSGSSNEGNYNFYEVDSANSSNKPFLTLKKSTSVADTQAPSTPSGLTAYNPTTSTVDLSWTVSSDNVGVTGYNVYVDSAYAMSVTGTNATVTGLSENTSYDFQVSAIDAASNESSLSSVVEETTAQSIIVTLYDVEGENSDVGLNDNGSKVYEFDPDIRIGGASSSNDRAMILVFTLPDLGSGNTITDASLNFSLKQIANNPSGNVDLYGLPYQSSLSIGSAQYYDGTYGGDGSADALQEDILTVSTSLGTITTNSTGSANLVDYLNAQYANGAVGGDYVLLRLNSGSSNEGNYNFYVVDSADSSNEPKLLIEVTGPSEN